jgi:hypothetical protein
MSLRGTFSSASINGWATNDYVDNPWVLNNIIIPDIPVANSSFGFSMALSGDGNYMVVGAPDYTGTGPSSGVAYVFYNSGGTWTQQALIQLFSSAANDQFGYSVAIDYSGSTIAIGAPQNNATGSVYVYARSGSSWNIQATLNSSTAQSGEQFGRSLSIDPSGSYLIIGAPFYDSGPDTNRGRAILYTRSGVIWTQGNIFTGNALTNDRYGSFVAINATSDFIVFSNGGPTTGVNATIYYAYFSGGVWVGGNFILFLNKSGRLSFSPDNLFLLAASLYKNTTYPAIPGTWTLQASNPASGAITDVIPSTSLRYALAASILYEGNNTVWNTVTTFVQPNGSSLAGSIPAISPDGIFFYCSQFNAIVNGIQSGGVYIFTKA